MAVERSIRERRKRRFQELLEDYGQAEGGFIDLNYLDRWVLMELDARRSGGPSWTTHDDWRELLDQSACQEYPEDWPASRLFDLDSGDRPWSTQINLSYYPEDLDTQPVVLTIRDPDYETEHVVDGDVRIIDIDLGSGCNGPKYFWADHGEEEGKAWLQRHREEVAGLPEGSPVRRRVEELCEMLEGRND